MMTYDEVMCKSGVRWSPARSITCFGEANGAAGVDMISSDNRDREAVKE